MLSSLLNAGKALFSPIATLAHIGIKIGLKPIKYFIDSHFRDKVVPIEGSVVYSDLWFAVEHSGIYISDDNGGQISNIVVDGIADSSVQISDPSDFTSKSIMGRKIYVSCNGLGAVGDFAVADESSSRVGERHFYGLVIKNCHHFCSSCIRSTNLPNKLSWVGTLLPETTWELTLNLLKSQAYTKLGATKWLLWDWDNQADNEPEPDWQANEDFFKNQPLTPEFIEYLKAEQQQTTDYQAEITDEDIPETVRAYLGRFEQTLQDVADMYDKTKQFLQLCPQAQFSYNQLKELQDCHTDFSALAQQLQNNATIKELARKMGRSYISEERKKQQKVPQASKSEVHGTHLSDDIARVLPSELINLDDETLETLFYARLFEKNLLCYELAGTSLHHEQVSEAVQKRTGPVVACLDTSASMQGKPLLKAKALLFAIANILKAEKRSLYVLLFGASGEIRQLVMTDAQDLAGLLAFLNQGFGGGTDFESPLAEGIKIIEGQKEYHKADILMISDGDCALSEAFTQKFNADKLRLNVMVYSVLCAGGRVADNFSDEVVVL
ncbi:VWA domain-containing protein [Psychrobacter sp. I-STPA10]|uniref:VWA domain-containing protein n=1 Tax=Psychrobacter sp. I-STPA10 TaxID=2585769 RepID=UPI001E62D464|nr:VWA domain-containing protein [Psychrobacter sp. I-STPA10]